MLTLSSAKHLTLVALWGLFIVKVIETFIPLLGRLVCSNVPVIDPSAKM